MLGENLKLSLGIYVSFIYLKKCDKTVFCYSIKISQFMKQGPYSEAGNRSAWPLPSHICDPEVCFDFHKLAPQDANFSQLNTFHTIIFKIWKSIVVLLFPVRLVLSAITITLGFTVILLAFLISLFCWFLYVSCAIYSYLSMFLINFVNVLIFGADIVGGAV